MKIGNQSYAIEDQLGIVTAFSQSTEGTIFDDKSSDAIVLHDHVSDFFIVIGTGNHKLTLDVVKQIDRKCDIGDGAEPPSHVRGYVAYDSEARICYAYLRENDISVFAHEFTHVTHVIADTLEIKPASQSEEWYCYMMSWLTRSIAHASENMARGSDFVQQMS